ncbi:Tyrosinase [Smittium mucronatum]|uniref:Tyrosinase n=1 Tax=Smittium mucronatum TaxID=133383 RepID=A0A1R0H5Z6_9FUNG|nr:Tyrosinase [Smittium mucronatum]
MKVSLIALSLIGLANSQNCASISNRKELRTLTTDEWNVFSSTIQEMQKRGWLAWYGYIHTQYFGVIHGSDQFLPFHRRFILEFESTGRNINPQFSQHYWDSSIDFNKPADSPILSSSLMGGNGVKPNMCVMNGAQSGWTISYPVNRCLTRSYDGGDTINPYMSPESISSDIQLSKNYKNFNQRIEAGMHNQVHASIGGDMAQAQSPVDVLFMLHHANVDRLWWKFQNAKPANLLDYSKDTRTTVSYFNTQVKDLLKVGEGILCYNYNDSPSKIVRRQETLIDDPTTFSNKSAIAAVTEVPEMSLTTGISSSNLSKFFPALASGNANDNSVNMPSLVSKSALEYAQQRQSSNSTTDSNAGPLRFPSQAPSFDVNSANPPVYPSKFRELSLNKSGSNSSAPSAIQKPKIPYPTKIPIDFLIHHRIDVNFYNAYYAEKVALVDALNADGYVSPYI